MAEKPRPTSSLAEKELDKAQAQFEAFDDQVKTLTKDRLDMTPKQEAEPQAKLSQKDIERSKDIYLKPHKVEHSREKFNENYRNDWNFAKEYVQFIAQNNEVIGEEINLWTKPFAGVPAENWKVPVNKPVWGPRYLAEQIKRKFYHRLKSENGMSQGADGMGNYYGSIVVDTTIQRLDCHPVSERKSIFMGSKGF